MALKYFQADPIDCYVYLYYSNNCPKIYLIVGISSHDTTDDHEQKWNKSIQPISHFLRKKMAT